ncbi:MULTISPECIES: hypothetical protein [Terrisporobacter]|uniref:Membrane protein n=2 Tax=Terrisporobacter TaxID=1505652 RepID=A0A0B3W2P0_9FIRM|nr:MULTISPECIES: hypothetical protein [Terrisporobacter]KHS56617.1 membrane protein [Terrisporobacter othiniensis]MCC3668214.1 hypothetical protein [Terrisporobacter mayombei]MCR1822192.1 hypothetical protein [Terrisporobacter muris]MDY3373420.1 hypothetical protein [Terrisporobacter othiniensis]
MRKKIISLLLLIMICVGFIPNYSFAAEEGKVIYISMNRTNINDLQKIPVLQEKLKNSGYIGLMNTRGDQGNDDARSYATIGAGTRANVVNNEVISFENLTDENGKLYKTATGEEPKGINNISINKSINNNAEKGSYGSTLGLLGQTLSDNNKKVALLGNSDIVENNQLIKIRNTGLIAMDTLGRVESGNVDNISVKDLSMPYGLRTDYNKLITDTKTYYESNDALFIELGDTYRLDEYKSNLNENTYNKTKKQIYSHINTYLKEVFNMVNENDVIYIVSEFPSTLDYNNKRRLAPVIKFSDNKKGLLESATTRRGGIIANLDLGVDILNEFGLKNEAMIGRALSSIEKDDNIDFLSGEYKKIVSINNIRSTVVNTFVGIVSTSWVIAMLALLFKDKLPNKEKVFIVLKELIKLGLIMPLTLLLSPIFNFKSQLGLVSGVVIMTIILYLSGRILFKNNDIKQMGYYALLTILLIVIDSVIGTYFMKNCIMSYDAIVGARYYGIGNEYEGVTIASAVFALSVLLNYKKMPKWLTIVLSVIILITSAFPSMGANVGGAISECVAYLLFIMLIFDVKLDLKKIMILGLAAVVLVLVFAGLDLVLGMESHLGVFTQQIIQEGPQAIFNTFGRKISMNLKLAKSSVWVNILLVGIAVIGIFIFRPSKHMKNISNKYPMIFKGFIASMVGCLITLLVNDSGIVAAATASIYILIPILIISINMIIFNDKRE